MYLWSEDTASRGPEEIASCLLYHLEKLPPTVTEIVLYSDSCSGQNRNITVSLMLKHFLSRSQNVQKITQKFLVTGHSYNSCNRNFGLIEKDSRKHKIIATLDEWASIIEKSKRSLPHLKVTQMKTTDFLSFTELEGMICNWKEDVGKNKAGKTADDFMNHNPSLLYPNGREISEAKKKDLMDLMPLVTEEMLVSVTSKFGNVLTSGPYRTYWVHCSLSNESTNSRLVTSKRRNHAIDGLLDSPANAAADIRVRADGSVLEDMHGGG
uniref:DUF7869 domain-containing protein n=1 Tax=Phlebotomus papatasi TaxID=29031 RepID=A0A1B0GMM9_PHLPP